MRVFRMLVIILVMMGYSQSGWAKRGKVPASMAAMQKALEVKGQTRNLTNFNLSKSEEDKINFVKRRHDYRAEIKTTVY